MPNFYHILNSLNYTNLIHTKSQTTSSNYPYILLYYLPLPKIQNSTNIPFYNRNNISHINRNRIMNDNKFYLMSSNVYSIVCMYCMVLLHVLY